MKVFLSLLLSGLLSVVQPIFGVVSSSAYLLTNLNNSTGDGTFIYVPFNAVSFDDGACFNLSNGHYTAPGDGTLIINGIVEVSKLSSSHQTLAIVVYNQTNSQQRYMYAINPYPLQDSVYPGYCQLPFATTMKCSAGDVFQLLVFVIGGNKTVDLVGGQAETRLSVNFFN